MNFFTSSSLICAFFLLVNPSFLFSKIIEKEFCANYDRASGSISITASDQATIKTGDIFINNGTVAVDSSKTYYISVPISITSDLSDEQIHELIKALLPEIQRQNESLMSDFSKDVEEANAGLFDKISTNQDVETQRILNQIETTFDRFIDLVESGVIHINKGIEKLNDFSKKDDWLEYHPFSKEGFALVTYKGGTRGALIKSPDFKIIQHCYDQKGASQVFVNITPFSEGGFSVATLLDNQKAFINENLKIISKKYDDAFLSEKDFGLVKQNDKYNYCFMPRTVDSRVKVISKKKYTFVEAEPFSDGFARVKRKKKSKWQYVNKNGEFFGKNFNNIGKVKNGNAIVSVKKGFIFKNDKFGVINRSGDYFVKPKYDHIEESHHLYLVTDNNVKKYIHKANGDYLKDKTSGKTLKLEKAEVFLSAMDVVCIRKKKEQVYYLMDGNGSISSSYYDQCYGMSVVPVGARGVGLYNLSGEMKLPPVHKRIYKKSNRVIRAELFNDQTVYYKLKKGNYVVIGTNSIKPSVQFDFGKDFHKGLAAVFFTGSNGKSGWGFINKEAQIVVDAIYSEVIADFKTSDFALVQKRNGQQVYIDRQGQERELSENTQVLNTFNN